MSKSALSWSDGKWGDGDVGEFFEPILALRLWSVSIYGVRDVSRLYSTSKAGVLWEPGVALEAECLARLFDGTRRRCLGPIPRRGTACGCGIYGIKDPGGVDRVRAAYSGTYGETLVVGVVKLWGRVLEGTLGYRAQFGYPAALALYEKSAVGHPLAEDYGVPLCEPDELSLDGIEKRGVLRRLKELAGG